MEVVSKSVSEAIKSIIDDSFDYVRSERKCPGISDREFVRLNISRVLLHSESGRGFLQYVEQVHDDPKARATYFSSLNSERREAMTGDLEAAMTKLLHRRLQEAGVDYLQQFKQLGDRDVFAFDGHCIEHACHDSRNRKGSFVASNTVYGLDLRTGLSVSIGLAAKKIGKGHDWPVFKLAFPSFRASLAKKSHPPLMIWDRAGVDNQFWSDAKMMRESGAQVVTRLKSNMELLIKEPLPFDQTLDVNTGICGQYMVGFNNSVTMRTVEYQDPETHEEFIFLTTNDDLEPGLIAWLYFLRWRIEKMYDLFKNRYTEKKAWAVSRSAQRVQAMSIAMTHNILVYLKEILGKDLNVNEEKLEKKRQYRTRQRERKAQERGRHLHPLTYTHPIIQLSAQFIRTVRNLITVSAPIRSKAATFRAAMSSYF